MDISLRNLFSRREISGEIISISRSLKNHFRPGSSLRKMNETFLKAASGNGFACGCEKPESLKIDLLISEKKFGEVVPSWVSASLHSDLQGKSKTRTIEGILTLSKMTHTDFPFQPWHFYYDWNYYVAVDKQYFYLNSPVNHDFNDSSKTATIECEWDTHFLPNWAWPMFGDRVKVIGRWIYDCGHPEKGKHKSEIHPPKAVVSFRSEAFKFRVNKSRVRANQAVVFMNERGGYYNQKINDQNYDFDLYLPPKPHASSKPTWHTRYMTSTRVTPVITPYPEDKPKLLRVHIPMNGKPITDGTYGAIISAGWTDPYMSEDFHIRKVTVKLTQAHLKDEGEWFSDEWYVYVGINGRWKQIFKSKDTGKYRLNHTVNLYLHKNDRIKVTAFGMEADPIHDLIGRNIGVDPQMVSKGGHSSRLRKDVALKISSGFLTLGTDLADGGSIENDPIGIIHSTLGVNRTYTLSPNAATKPAERYKYRNKYNITVSTIARELPVYGSRYYMEAQVSGHYLDVKGGSTASGVTIWQYKKNFTEAQIWRFKHIPGSNNLFNIISVRSGKYLSLKASSNQSGAYSRIGVYVTQYSKASSSTNPLRFYSQQWKLIPNGAYYIIENVLTGLVLDVKGGSKDSGVQVWQYRKNNTAAQNWKIIRG